MMAKKNPPKRPARKPARAAPKAPPRKASAPHRPLPAPKSWLNRSRGLALAALLLALTIVPLQGIYLTAAEIYSSTWSETAASNNSTPPDGAPEGQAPSTVNNVIREVMAQVKRLANHIGATVTSGGSSGVYTLSYTVAPSTYYNGETYSFKANHTNGSTGASLNISSLGAKSLVKPSTNGLLALSASDIAANNHVVVQYDSGVDQFVVVSMLPVSSSGGTVTSVATGDGLTGGTITTTGTLALSVNTLTTLASPATNDELPIYDTSAAAHRRITLQDLLAVLNVLTEETSVQAATDYVLLYDASAGAVRKVKPSNLGAGKLAQMVGNQTGALTAISTSIPWDDSIPQNTEGTEILTQAITPTNSSSKLYIDVSVNYACNQDAHQMVIALFQDSTAGALAATAGQCNDADPGAIHFRHQMTAGTTSSTTFKVRVGLESTGAFSAAINGYNGARELGGVSVTGITIMEVTP